MVIVQYQIRKPIEEPIKELIMHLQPHDAQQVFCGNIPAFQCWRTLTAARGKNASQLLTGVCLSSLTAPLDLSSHKAPR